MAWLEAPANGDNIGEFVRLQLASDISSVEKWEASLQFSGTIWISQLAGSRRGMVDRGMMKALSASTAALAAVLVLVAVTFVTHNTGYSVLAAKGVSRISIFDQWSEPAEAAGQNPSIVRFGMKDMERTRDKCIAKCQDRPGYNPTKADVEICERFCHRVADSVTPFEPYPQPAQHSWWSRVGPDGEESRYLANEKKTPEFDPAARPKLKQAHPTHKVMLAKHEAHRRAGTQGSAEEKKGRVSMLLQTSAQTESGHGLDQISYSHEDALSEMADYFDSLPTKDCAHPDCNYRDKVEKLHKVLVKKGHKFTTADIKNYETKVLGYHRRHEAALEHGELQKIGQESDRMMSNSIQGYNQLEAEARARHPKTRAPAVSEHPRARHSVAYLKAKQAPGFQGYSYNIFSEKENQLPVEEVEKDGGAQQARRGGGQSEGAEQRKAAEHDARLRMDEAALAQMQGKVHALERANAQLQDVSSALSKVVLASKTNPPPARNHAAQAGAPQQQQQQEKGEGEGGSSLGALEEGVIARTQGTLERQLHVLRSNLAAAQTRPSPSKGAAGTRWSAGREAAVKELRAADDALLQGKLAALTRKAQREQGSLMRLLKAPAVPGRGAREDEEAKQLLGYSPRKVAHLEQSEWRQLRKESSF